MDITLLTYGSRGDVQPFVALGRGLQRAGHTVRLAAPAVFEDFVRRFNLDFAPLPGNPAELVQRLVEQTRRSGGLLGAIRAIGEYGLPLGRDVLTNCLNVCTDADLVIHSFLLTMVGHQAAVEFGIPEIGAHLFPIFSATGAFPNMMFPRWPLGARYNRLTHHLFTQTFWQGNRVVYGYLRHKHPDLPRLTGWPFGGNQPAPLLYAISPQVMADAAWPEHVHVTGYWFLDEDDWQPPADLAAFLEAGPPPVAIGFGSTLGAGIEQAGAIAVEALRRSGQRGVILGGWAGIDEVIEGDDLFAVESVPHHWLFPRVAAVVHHGGAGTTAAGLRAGVPSILTPFSSDQPWWGWRVHQLGVGPQPIPYRQITVAGLAAAMTQAVSDNTMRTRAAALGNAIRAEDGVGDAVRLIARLC